MITRYFVNCFERELCIKWDDAYKYLEKEIIDMLDIIMNGIAQKKLKILIIEHMLKILAVKSL